MVRLLPCILLLGAINAIRHSPDARELVQGQASEGDISFYRSFDSHSLSAIDDTTNPDFYQSRS